MDPSDLVLNSIQHGVFNVVADRDLLSLSRLADLSTRRAFAMSTDSSRLRNGVWHANVVSRRGMRERRHHEQSLARTEQACPSH